MSYPLNFDILIGSSNTGLNLRAQLYDNSDTPVGGPVTSGFIEPGASGFYIWKGDIPDGHQGYVTFVDDDTDEFKSGASINPSEVENPFLKTLTYGSVDDSTPAAGNFNADSTLAAPVDDHWNGIALFFIDGINAGLGRRVFDFTASTRNLAFDYPFPQAPADEDRFVLVGRID